eukprot:CAMPEP_0197683276 /NCGR_PEP_ID=MMETSP1338-20131121/97688_1 /TAXON_ID=43686 ORGANISM="Pelagodinium beii, Strain RCC1491" /NCGR_SAMPLE_ID=MMETSP1338 /ASSEMBLY_ACC=CAM_ASM_000754 /LENGTH=368 /DNA_ID=CAMNT_0043264843 /DNA_START=67 /DNA_END=1170 /DNA_ORIENTATION=+
MASMAASRGLYAVEGLRRGPGDRMGPSNGISSSGRSSGIAGPGTGLQARGSLGLRDDRYLARANMLSGPVPPPLPSHLSGHHGAASHTSAGSRSVPPGSRRPTTPSGTQYQGPRRPSGATDDPTARLASGALPQSNAFDGRDVLPVRSAGDANRSRSVTNSGARFGAGSGVQDRERPREGLSSGGSSGSSTCDKCDGKHPTDRCPHFRGEREKHKDAWCNYGNKNAPHHMGSAGGNFVLKSARVCRQPGDGSCLFHSMLHGLQQHGSSQGSNSAQALRRELASFLQQNSSRQIAGDTLEEWVRWDANSSVNEYARRMAVGGWGGGIEMACCSLLKNVNVHVYETSGRAEFKRISCFDCPNAARTIHVL